MEVTAGEGGPRAMAGSRDMTCDGPVGIEAGLGPWHLFAKEHTSRRKAPASARSCRTGQEDRV